MFQRGFLGNSGCSWDFMKISVDKQRRFHELYWEMGSMGVSKVSVKFKRVFEGIPEVLWYGSFKEFSSILGMLNSEGG